MKSLTLTFGFLCCCTVVQANNEMTTNDKASPLQTDKVTVALLEQFALEKQVPNMAGYDIRARKIIIAAGGSIGEHEHSTRAGIVYILSGEVIEYRGENARVLKSGDTLVEDAGTVHSYKNVSKQDCVAIAFDLPKTQG